ncbi:MAG: hypothetical protein LHV68_08670 [Elusimicrobia bacterium]|nr:hypothetical protein [Candidatus Liberimonas magnetica]
MIYTLLTLSIIYFGILLWKKACDWGYISLACLIVIMTFMIMLDSGKLYKYKLIFADKNYSIIGKDIENVLENNIDNIGQAIVNIYDRYYIIENYDLTKNSQNWKIEKVKGRDCMYLKLKYIPLEKTIDLRCNLGTVGIASDGYYKSGYYISRLSDSDPEMTKDKFMKLVQDYKLIIEVRYLRKADYKI